MFINTIISPQEYNIVFSIDTKTGRQNFYPEDIIMLQYDFNTDVKPAYSIGSTFPYGYCLGGSFINGEIAVQENIKTEKTFTNFLIKNMYIKNIEENKDIQGYNDYLNEQDGLFSFQGLQDFTMMHSFDIYLFKVKEIYKNVIQSDKTSQLNLTCDIIQNVKLFKKTKVIDANTKDEYLKYSFVQTNIYDKQIIKKSQDGIVFPDLKQTTKTTITDQVGKL